MPRRLSRPFYPRLSRSLNAAAEQEVSRRRRNQSVGCTACRRWVDAKEAGRADNPTLTTETAADADPAVSSWMYDVSPPPWTSTFPGPNPRLTLTLTGDIQFQESILAWNISWKFNWNFHLTWKFHGISVKRRDVSIVNLSRYHCFCYVYLSIMPLACIRNWGHSQREFPKPDLHFFQRFHAILLFFIENLI